MLVVLLITVSSSLLFATTELRLDCRFIYKERKKIANIETANFLEVSVLDPDFK